MDLKNKNVLVIGLARTGIATVKTLDRLGASITINDIKKEENVLEELDKLKDIPITYILGSHPEEVLDGVDLVVPNPGVPLDLPILLKARQRGIAIISEVELAFRLTKATIVGITGTNGKTTTTTLTGEIFKNAQRKSYVVGNIGIPVISKALEAEEEDVLICELSSFQLEPTELFRPRVCSVLNITPDHLNRHKTMENYIAAKARIFSNQRPEDYTILNYDDEITWHLSRLTKAIIIPFSRKAILEKGVFVKDNYIVVKDEEAETKVCRINDIAIPGSHNLENALAATAMAWVMGIAIEDIAQTLKSFKGVEHRIEMVDTVKGVRFINDSKATNPDAAIKAVEAVNAPIVLIAGGMNKDNDYTDFIKAFNNKVKHIILLGETKDQIESQAKAQGFYNITKVENLSEAVKVAFNIAREGDNVLLSPACASWDMFESFEHRGKVFKQEVYKLREA